MPPSKVQNPPRAGDGEHAQFAGRQAPDNWLAGEVGRTDPGSEAWSLIHWLMVNNKSRFLAIGQEFELAPQQVITIRILGGGPRPMGELAKLLACDSSNVTGITDRLEERGLVQRASAEHDRRVKMLVLTPDGQTLRTEITKRLAEPPPEIASLSEKDQRALRDIMRRALENREAPSAESRGLESAPDARDPGDGGARPRRGRAA